VPVIVCNVCKDEATAHPRKLTCELCKEGYSAPDQKPDLIALKRKAEAVVEDNGSGSHTKASNDEIGVKKKGKFQAGEYITSKDRVFVSRVPMTATKTKLLDALSPVVKSRFSGIEKKAEGIDIKAMEWLVSKSDGAFFGSCIIQMSSPEIASRVVQHATNVEGGVKMDKKKLRVEFTKIRCDQINDPFPSLTAAQGEYPPIGVFS
tara:strand:+ start:204 stop:821 length:618 start_codon:yes stop_codon:yes gene_type:complete